MKTPKMPALGFRELRRLYIENGDERYLEETRKWLVYCYLKVYEAGRTVGERPSPNEPWIGYQCTPKERIDRGRRRGRGSRNPRIAKLNPEPRLRIWHLYPAIADVKIAAGLPVPSVEAFYEKYVDSPDAEQNRERAIANPQVRAQLAIIAKEMVDPGYEPSEN